MNIHYSESFLSFIKSEQGVIQRLLSNAHYCGTGGGYNAYRLLVTNAEIDYLTLRSDGTISYLPAGKEHKTNDDGTWKRDGRQNGKPGKVIRKLFTKKAQKLLKDSDFEIFANFYKSKFNDDGYVFKLLPANIIPDIYDRDSDERAPGDSSLNNSCMNGEGGYLDMYANCKHLQILILKNKDEKLCGRALVWKLDDNITFMDRVYVAEDFMYEMFVTYAAEQKWWRKKSYKSRDNIQSFVDAEGNNVQRVFTIKLDTDFDKYPYIDTFHYGGHGFIKNDSSGCCFTYDDTGGARDGYDDDDYGTVYDEIYECTISEDDARRIDRGRYRGQWTHVDNIVEDVHGDDWWKDDENIIEIDGDYYPMDEIVYSEYDSQDYPEKDCVYSKHVDSWIKEDESVEIDGEYYPENHDDIVKIDGEYYLKDSEEIEYLGDGVYQVKTETE